MLMKVTRRIRNARGAALASLAAAVLFMTNGASAHYTKIWHWEIPMAWIKRGTMRTLTPHDKAYMADKY